MANLESRAEHLAWAKKRALEYIERGDPAAAITSMISDLGQHDAWVGSSVAMTLFRDFMMDRTTRVRAPADRGGQMKSGCDRLTLRVSRC